MSQPDVLTAAFPFEEGPSTEPVLPLESIEAQDAAPAEPSHWGRRLVAAGLCALALAGCTSNNDGEKTTPAPTGIEGGLPPEFNKGGEQNLLTGNWRFVPGASLKDGILHVTRTGGATLLTRPEEQKTATPRYDSNPPVVLYGPHVELAQKGNVGVAATLANIQGQSTVSVLSAPTRRFDERVEHQPGIDVSVDGPLVSLKVWDGHHDKPDTSQVKLEKPVSGEADIVLAQQDRQMTITVNGQKLPEQPAILGNKVWMGMDTSGEFDITSLNIYPIGTNEAKVVDTSAEGYFTGKLAENGLATIAAKHGHGKKQIGTAVDLAELMSNPAATNFILQNYNTIETETLAKPQALQPERGQFQFAELDALVAFANEHNLAVHGHTLVFGEAYAKWLHDDLEKATPEEALDIMRTHIKTVVERYNGKNGHGLIKYWDVVNEPFDPDEWDQLNKQNIWYKAIGEKYILEAFKAAREANPEGVFGLNEWGIETDPDRKGSLNDPEYKKGVIGLIKKLPKGTIDFVGLQAHFDEDTLDDDAVMDGIYSGNLSKIFAEFAALGTDVRISEATVAENGDPETQSDVYRMLLEACMKAPNCIGFNVWGALSNPAYFTSSREDGIGDDAPAKQDANGKIVERPAMAGLREGAAA